MKIAYADPPYLGCSKFYPEKQEMDHAELIKQLEVYDAWALSCHTPSLKILLPMCPDDARVAAWVKPFCAFKVNVNPAYAWEPVIFKPARGRFSRKLPTVRDWVSANITIKKGMVGVKPTGFCYWLFELLGAREDDEFLDIFPGTGIVSKCWQSWCDAKRCSQEVMELKK